MNKFQRMGQQGMRVDSRAEFISKTYMHLFGAIMAFVGVSAVFAQSGAGDRALNMLAQYGNMAWFGVLGAFMLVSWIATHMAQGTKSKSTQYAGLGLYVFAEAILFIPLFALAEKYSNGGSNIISNAFILTSLGFGGLTAIAFITRKDFSFLRSVLMWGGLAAIGLIIGGAIFGFNLGLFFSVAMVAFAGAAILYDTSNVIHHYDESQYVAASLQLFASFALMLWYVIQILISMAGDD